MNKLAAVEKLQALILDCELPKTDMARYGIKCPYCGKSDRIQQLERPEQLAPAIGPSEASTYADLWRQLVGSDESAGICKFCQHLLKLVDDGHAEPFHT